MSMSFEYNFKDRKQDPIKWYQSTNIMGATNQDTAVGERIEAVEEKLCLIQDQLQARSTQIQNQSTDMEYVKHKLEKWSEEQVEIKAALTKLLERSEPPVGGGTPSGVLSGGMNAHSKPTGRGGMETPHSGVLTPSGEPLARNNGAVLTPPPLFNCKSVVMPSDVDFVLFNSGRSDMRSVGRKLEKVGEEQVEIRAALAKLLERGEPPAGGGGVPVRPATALSSTTTSTPNSDDDERNHDTTVEQTGSATEYVHKFVEWAAPLEGMSEGVALASFIKGLKPTNKNESRLWASNDLGQTMELAQLMEEKNKAVRSIGFASPNSRNTTSRASRTYWSNNNNDNTPTRTGDFYRRNTGEDRLLTETQINENNVLESLVLNLLRLSESDPDEVAAVYSTLTTIENLMEVKPAEAEMVCERTRLLRWIIRKIKVRDLDSNKQHTSEILSILLQSSVENHKRLGQMNGVDVMLRAVAMYKSRDPKSLDEEVMVENLFDCLCCMLMPVENKERFLKFAAEVEQIIELLSSLGNMCLLLEHATDYEGSVKLHATDSKALIKMGSIKVVEICRVLIGYPLKSDPEFCNEILRSMMSTCSRIVYESINDCNWYVSLLGEMARIPHLQKGEEIENQLIDMGLRVKDARPEPVRVGRELLIKTASLGTRKKKIGRSDELKVLTEWQGLTEPEAAWEDLTKVNCNSQNSTLRARWKFGTPVMI